MFLILIQLFTLCSFSSESVFEAFSKINNSTPKCSNFAIEKPQKFLGVKCSENASHVDLKNLINVDPKNIGQKFLGNGVHAWTSDLNIGAADLFSELNISNVRFTAGADWDKISKTPPTRSTPEEMDKFVQENFEADYSGRAQSLLKFDGVLKEKNISKDFVQFRAPKIFRDKNNQLKKESIRDYALFLASMVGHIDKLGVSLDRIELGNEPDGTWDTYMTPATYRELAISFKAEMKRRGLNRPLVCGPGLARLSEAQAYLSELDKNPEAIDEVCFHAWDQKWNNDLNAKKISEWAQKHKKNLRITEIAEAETHWYQSGKLPDKTDDKDDSISYRNEYGVKSYRNALKMFNHGSSSNYAWEALDQNWNNMSWGLVGKNGEKKPAYYALRSMNSYLEKGMNIINLNLKNSDNESTISAFDNDNQLVLLLSNDTSSPKKIKVNLSKFDALSLKKVHSYPDGDLNIDKKIDTDLKNLNCIVEITIPPMSSKTLVFAKGTR